MTSSIGGDYKDENGRRQACKLDSSNGLLERLAKDWKPSMKGLMIASDPEDAITNRSMTGIFMEAFSMSGLDLWEMKCLEKSTRNQAQELIQDSDLIILAGGHVPTQNRFFREIQLKELLKEYKGIIIGISAGSMNCAEVVYASPELDGEALDPEYSRFLPGLALSSYSVFPHFQYVRGLTLDGLRIVEDILYPDSARTPVLAIPDGSYLLVEGEKETLYGEAFFCLNGVLQKICEPGQSLKLHD